MEVHHHPEVEKKGIKEYFLEGLMIFLAVTMGFVAENIREHFVEVRNTRQYLETFKQELINNKRVFAFSDSAYQVVIPSQDSMIQVFFEKRENQDLRLMGRLLNGVKQVISPAIDKAAYQQLVNSGGLKNLDNLALKDSMSTYAGQIEEFEVYNSITYNRLGNALPEIMKLEDVHDWRPRASRLEYVPAVTPYPELTERERRLMIYYYSNYRNQYLADMRKVERLEHSNDRLKKMIDDILDK